MLITEPEPEQAIVSSSESVAEPLASGEPMKLIEWMGLAAVVAIAGVLRLWDLERNGYGNVYYAAAVRGMLVSWSNFFFGSFDPAGFVTVDKPPVAIWIQAISAKLFGYSGISLLVPEALMGTATVVMTYHLVRRSFGAAAGLIAGLVLAITPIGVAVDRDNLPDTALVFVLVLSAWALIRAVETGKLVPLLLSAALVGVGFNVKMLAAFVVLPTFYVSYFLAAKTDWKLRLVNLTVATIVLVGASLSWSIAVELTPKSKRPYIGGSTNNSAIELALGYNGLGRILGGHGNGPPPGMMARLRAQPGNAPAAKDQATPKSEPPATTADAASGPSGGFPPGGPPFDEAGGPPFGGPGGPPFGGPGGPGGGMPGFGGPGGPGGGMPGFGGAPGFLRFTRASMAPQITWLFPIAILGALVAALRAPRSLPLGSEHFSLFLWGGWLATHWVVFSFAKGTFHEYYTVIMGPAVAALVGIGVVALYQDWKRNEGRGYLPTALIITACWEAYVILQSPESKRWLYPAIEIGTLLSVIGLLVSRHLDGRRGADSLLKLATCLGIGTLLLGPGVWSVAAVAAKGGGMLPAARISDLTGERVNDGMMPPMPSIKPNANARLMAFLKANHHGERIFLAAPSSMDVSSIIIVNGENAVALGGFMGGDPIVTKDEFAEMVKNGEVRFVMSGGGPGGMMGPPPGMGGPPGRPGMPGPPGMGGPFGGGSAVMAWVREHGKEVDKSLWKNSEDDERPAAQPGQGSTPDPTRMSRMMQRSSKLYDCRPERGLVNVDPVSTTASVNN